MLMYVFTHIHLLSLPWSVETYLPFRDQLLRFYLTQLHGAQDVKIAASTCCIISCQLFSIFSISFPACFVFYFNLLLPIF